MKREQPRWERTRRNLSRGNWGYYLAGSLAAMVIGFSILVLKNPEFMDGFREILEGIRHRSGKAPASVIHPSSPNVRIISGNYVTNPEGGMIFVVRGAVKDERKGADPAPIRLRATLWNAEEMVLAEKTFIASSEISRIGLAEEIASDNLAVGEEGGWVSFAVEFFDPGVVSGFSVTVVPG